MSDFVFQLLWLSASEVKKRSSPRNGTGCAVSFRKTERRQEGWEEKRTEKGESWREGEHIKMDRKCQVQIRFWSLADTCASPARNNWFSWCEVDIYWNESLGLVTDPEPSDKMQIKLQVWISKCPQISACLVVQFGIPFPLKRCLSNH